ALVVQRAELSWAPVLDSADWSSRIRGSSAVPSRRTSKSNWLFRSGAIWKSSTAERSFGVAVVVSRARVNRKRSRFAFVALGKSIAFEVAFRVLEVPRDVQPVASSRA